MITKVVWCLLPLLMSIGAWALGILPIMAVNIIALGLIGILFCWALLKKSPWIGNLLLGVTCGLLTLIIADAVLRIIPPRHLYLRPHERFSWQLLARPYLGRYRPNVTFRGEVYGDLAILSGLSSLQEKRQEIFRTDAFGFRNDPVQTGAPPYQVIVLGDSFGLGEGTSQELTWASLLQSQYAIKTYNLSMSGGPWQHYLDLLIEFERLRIRPNTIILLALFTGNDLEDFYGYTNDLAQLPENSWFDRLLLSFTIFQTRSPIQRLFQRLLRPPPSSDFSYVLIKNFLHIRDMAFLKSYIERGARPASKIPMHPHFTYFTTTLEDIRNFCQQHALNLNIILFPTKSEVYRWVIDEAEPWTTDPAPSGFSSILRQYCTQRNIPYLDLKPILMKAAHDAFASSQQVVWWYDDTHINPLGHRAVADAVYQTFLRSTEEPQASDSH